MSNETKVLVVDDDPKVRNALAIKLQEAGYEVLTCSDGVEAVKVLKEMSPSVVVLDLLMPNMDGISYMRRLRKIDRENKVKVIVLTNLDVEKLMNEANELGAYDYLIKSNVSLKKVVECVNSCLIEDIKK